MFSPLVSSADAEDDDLELNNSGGNSLRSPSSSRQAGGGSARHTTPAAQGQYVTLEENVETADATTVMPASSGRDGRQVSPHSGTGDAAPVLRLRCADAICSVL